MDAQPKRFSAHEKVVELLRLEAAAIERSSSVVDAEAVETAVKLLHDCGG